MSSKITIIGAGSVVTKDIPPNVVAVGMPVQGATGNQRLRQGVLPQGHENRLVRYRRLKYEHNQVRWGVFSMEKEDRKSVPPF